MENKRIIEKEFPIGMVSKIGSKERYLHGKTAHSLFIWWARRPFTAMRAVVLASLMPVNHEAMTYDENLVEKISSEIIPSPDIVKKTHDLLLSAYGYHPRLLDIFGGGGTIALEAGRLGCEAFTLDINPLAYFIQKFIMEYSQERHDLPELVNKYGKRLLNKLKVETQRLYRRDVTSDPFEQRLVFLWGRTIRCINSECGKIISLSGDWYVSKKRDKKVLLLERADKVSGTYVRELVFNPKEESFTHKMWKPVKGIRCPFCGYQYNKEKFQELTQTYLGDELLCVRVAKGHVKQYILPASVKDYYPPQDEIEETIQDDLNLIGQPLPETELPRWSGIVNPALYGARYHADLFNPRQLAVLLKVVRALRELNTELVREGFSKRESLAITYALSAFVDQLVDWNSRLSMWIEENEQVGRALSGPGIPMFWRYAEIDPFTPSPANLYDKLNRMVEALKFIPRFSTPTHVYMTSATSLPFEDKSFDAIVTDPAYGDNLFYSVLAECVYVWKRMIFKDLLPEIFNSPSISKDDEIVAPVWRYSFPDAMKFYEERLTLALREAGRVLKPEGIVSLFFTHGTSEAWELIIRAFRNASFQIITFWPILIERRARPRGMRSKAINVSVVIVARHKPETSITCSWCEVEEEINKAISDLSSKLASYGWKKEDIAWGCFAKSVGVVAKYDKIVDRNDILSLKDCINRCALQIQGRFSSLSLKIRPNNSVRELVRK